MKGSLFDEFELLAAAVLDGTASRADIVRFNAVMRNCPELRQVYQEQARLHAMLVCRGEGLAAVRMPETALKARTGLRHAAHFWLKAAALAVVAGGLLVVGGRQMLEHTATAARRERCALQVVRTADARGLALPPATDDGAVVVIEAGEAVLRLRSGVELTLQGPARAICRDGMNLVLEQGRLVVRVPDVARGFVVLTPGLAMRDLGSVFAVEAGAAGSDLFVCRGDVQVSDAAGLFVGICQAGEGVRARQGSAPEVCGRILSQDEVTGLVAEADTAATEVVLAAMSRSLYADEPRTAIGGVARTNSLIASLDTVAAGPFRPKRAATELVWNGKSGVWSDGAGNWRAGGDETRWYNNMLDGAVFDGPPGRITIGGVVAASNLVFRTSGHAIAGGRLELGGGTVAVEKSCVATISATIEGSTGLVKAGQGTLVLSGSNTYSGATVVQMEGGGLVVDSLAPVGVPCALGLGAPGMNRTAPIRFQSDTRAIRLLKYTGRAVFCDRPIFVETVWYRGLILDASGSGALVLGAPAGSPYSIGVGNGVNSSKGADILWLAGSSAPQIVNGISGDITDDQTVLGTDKNYPLNIVKQGPSTWALQGPKHFRGVVTVEDGELQYDSIADEGVASALGCAVPDKLYDRALGPVSFSVSLGAAATHGTLRYVGAADCASNRRIALAGDGRLDAGAAAGTGALVFRGSIASSAGGGLQRLILAGDNPGTNTIEGVIADGVLGGRVALVKRGGGQWILSGRNTYTGGTTVEGGTLKLRGGNDCLASTGRLALAADGRLDLARSSQTVAALDVSGGTLQVNVAADGTCGNLRVGGVEPVDLSRLRVKIMNPAGLHPASTYVLVTGEGPLVGMPTLSGVPSSWILVNTGNTLLLGRVNGTVIRAF